MKTIVAGSREINDYKLVKRACEASGFHITEVVCGCARGVDMLGKRWAEENGIPVKEFHAPWDSLGAGAGPFRNRQMAEYADALIAVHDGTSRGTANMIHEAKKRGLEILVVTRE